MRTCTYIHTYGTGHNTPEKSMHYSVLPEVLLETPQYHRARLDNFQLEGN